MDTLILRFDAPLMSFGGVMVDHHGPTDRFPGLSMLTGLFANALGYYHGDTELLERLQSRIEYAARWDVEPEIIVEYHTVDLGQPKMLGYADKNKKSEHGGWTTRGKPEHRAGGDDARYGTHQRFRHYWADGVMTVAVILTGDDEPSTSSLEAALRNPARPLFLGRKTCLPASPVLVGWVQSEDVLGALQITPRALRSGQDVIRKEMEACWPSHIGTGRNGREVFVYDRRDWINQVHAGSRLRMEGLIQEVAK